MNMINAEEARKYTEQSINNRFEYFQKYIEKAIKDISLIGERSFILCLENDDEQYLDKLCLWLQNFNYYTKLIPSRDFRKIGILIEW